MKMKLSRRVDNIVAKLRTKRLLSSMSEKEIRETCKKFRGCGVKTINEVIRLWRAETNYLRRRRR